MTHTGHRARTGRVHDRVHHGGGVGVRQGPRFLLVEGGTPRASWGGGGVCISYLRNSRNFSRGVSQSASNFESPLRSRCRRSEAGGLGLFLVQRLPGEIPSPVYPTGEWLVPNIRRGLTRTPPNMDKSTVRSLCEWCGQKYRRRHTGGNLWPPPASRGKDQDAPAGRNRHHSPFADGLI